MEDAEPGRMQMFVLRGIIVLISILLLEKAKRPRDDSEACHFQHLAPTNSHHHVSTRHSHHVKHCSHGRLASKHEPSPAVLTMASALATSIIGPKPDYRATFAAPARTRLKRSWVEDDNFDCLAKVGLDNSECHCAFRITLEMMPVAIATKTN